MSASSDAARHVVRRSTDLGALETSHPTELRAEIAAVLAPFETKGALPGENAREVLIGKLAALMMDSKHVDEVFGDDDVLHRILTDALADFDRELTREKKPRAATPAPPAVKAAKPATRVSLADEGFAFPLFEGTRAEARLDPAGPCAACSTAAPTLFEGHCYACFREGIAASTRETERGTVSPEEAEEGLTQGAYAEASEIKGMDVVKGAEDPDGTWYRFRFPTEGLQELLRTPAFVSNQTPTWLLHCGAPMVFVGTLDEARIAKLCEKRKSSPVQLFASMLEVDEDDAEELVEDTASQSITAYAFRCSKCDKLRGNWDRK